MDRIVYKYMLQPGETEIDLPYGTHILRAHQQEIAAGEERIFLWALLPINQDPKVVQTVKRKFHVYPTGIPIENDKLVYFDTVFLYDGKLVFHVFQYLS